MRWHGRLDTVLEAVVAALMALICVVVFLGVIYRYVLLDPLAWTEEVARLCLVWITFLGAYLAYRRGMHISIDVVRRRVSPRMQRVIHLVVSVLVGVLMATLVVEGALYSQAFLSSGTPLLGIPLGVVYAALPISAALLLVSVLAELLDLLRGWARHEGSALAKQPKGDPL